MTKWMLTFDAVLDDYGEVTTRVTVRMTDSMKNKLLSNTDYSFYEFLFDDGTPLIITKDSIIQLVYISEG